MSCIVQSRVMRRKRRSNVKALMQAAGPALTLWPRDPPIRVRKEIPTRWLRLVISEGRNRQVRRMTTRIGFPTLRPVRWRIGEWTLEGIPMGS